MGNINNTKIIKIYGITLARPEGRARAYGHGRTKLEIDGEDTWIEYVDYYIDDLIILIKNQGLEKVFIKKLSD